MSTPLAGQLRIQLHPDLGVRIDSTRPTDLTRHFIGLSAAEVQARVPLLFALCGQAQARAAVLALNAAGAALEEGAARVVWIEAALEYLWRFAIDLPAWAGLPQDMASFASLRKTMRDSPVQADQTLRRYLDELLTEPVLDWQQADARTLESWLQTSDSRVARLLREVEQFSQREAQPSPVVPSLPAFPAARMLSLLDQPMRDSAFCAQPNWLGQFTESSVLAYQAHHPWIERGLKDQRPGALLRLMARLLELAALLERMEGRGALDSGSEPMVEGVGIGWVHTARGLLLHRAELAQGRVCSYAILAPTEWNFHPQGPLVAGLAPWQQVAVGKRQRWAELEILALDPCVGYQLEVYDA